MGWGLRLLTHLRVRLTVQADDSHAAPVPPPSKESNVSIGLQAGCQTLVRFFALFRIKPHAPPLVRVPVNSFEF